MCSQSDVACACSEIIKAGLRCTKQRTTILAILRDKQGEHLSAEEVHALAKEQMGKVSLATVYNTLECLVAARLIRKMIGNAPHAAALYDGGKHDHIHLHNLQTGDLKDAPHVLSEQILARFREALQPLIEHETNFKIENIHIDILGSPRTN